MPMSYCIGYYINFLFFMIRQFPQTHQLTVPSPIRVAKRLLLSAYPLLNNNFTTWKLGANINCFKTHPSELTFHVSKDWRLVFLACNSTLIILNIATSVHSSWENVYRILLCYCIIKIYSKMELLWWMLHINIMSLLVNTSHCKTDNCIQKFPWIH